MEKDGVKVFFDKVRLLIHNILSLRVLKKSIGAVLQPDGLARNQPHAVPRKERM